MIDIGVKTSSREQSLSPFIPNQPLVDDDHISCILYVDADDLRNDYVEEHYGPFTDNNSRGYSTPETYSPKPSISSRSDELKKRTEEIDALKRMIKEKELAKQRKEPEPKLVVEEAQEKIDTLIVQNEKTIQQIIAEDEEDMDIDDDDDSNIQSPPTTDDIMRDIALDILDSKTTNEAPNSDEEIDELDSDSSMSYTTAKEEFSDDDKTNVDLNEEQRSLQESIDELEKKLNSVSDDGRDIRLQISYLQVKMSMANNKKNKNKRPNNFTKSSSTNHKRPQLELNNNYINNNNNRGYTYYPQQHHRQPHYQQYHQSYITPPPSSPAYLQKPPPPPSELPPPLSPPPPPPPRHKSVETLRDALKIMENIIKTAIFAAKPQYPVIEKRHLPRPRRLVTIDNYTMTMNMVFLNKEYEIDNQVLKREHSFLLPSGQPGLYIMDNKNYESPLAVLLYRKAENKKFDGQLQSAITAILLSIPNDVDLSTFHSMRFYSAKMENTYNLVCAFNHDYPRNHLLAALKLELSKYVHGKAQFQADFEECITRIPNSVDLYWQYIIEEHDYTVRLERFKYVLSLFHSSEQDASHCKVELLTRLIRIGGIRDVINIMTQNTTIDTSKSEIITLQDPLQLLEEDKYYIWMLIVHYLIVHTLPQGVCDMWMNGLVKEGQPNMAKVLFSIDWSDALKDQPLDRDTLYQSTNILLSMLAHFGQVTCNDIQKKPLLIGVLRTIVTFLSYVPSFLIDGTFELVNKFQSVEDLSPEIQEILTDLELKKYGNLQTVIRRLFDGNSMLTRPQSFAIAYRSVCMYCERINYTTENIVLLACILSIPLASDQTNRANVENIIINNMKSLDYEAKVTMVKGILDKYKNLVRSDIDASSTFVWINLLLLLKIHEKLCPIERNNIREDMRKCIGTGRGLLTSKDAEMLLLKYANQLVQ